MRNEQYIRQKAFNIRESVNRLVEFQNMSLDAFKRNKDNYAIAEHHLRRALENCFDMGRHILVKSGLGHPGNYREVIILLSDFGILPEDFANQIKGMAGYRNRLIHEYDRIDQEEIYKIINKHLDDFGIFLGYLLNYIEQKDV